MEVATMTSKGQLTVPVSIRKQLGLEAGSKLGFIQLDDGTVQLKSLNSESITDLAGILHQPGKAASIEDMRDAITLEAVAGAEAEER